MFGCVVTLAVPVPPVLDFGAVVVVDDAGLVVVVVVDADDDELELLDALELDDELELDDPDDCCGVGAAVVVVVVEVDVVVVVDVVDVVVVAAWDDGFESSRSPGLAIASATPAMRMTAAAIRTGRARDLIVRGERVTGVEPASPAWKAGALPLSYTRGPGGR